MLPSMLYAEHSLGPSLRSGDLPGLSLLLSIQIIDNIIVVVCSIVVHIPILKEFRSTRREVIRIRRSYVTDVLT